MRLIIFALALTHLFTFTLAQKKKLDYEASEAWPVLRAESISNDGKYTIYSINSNKTGTRYVVQATANTWKKEFFEVRDIAFSQDSRFLIFLNKGDSLGLLDLNSGKIKYISQVASFKFPLKGNGRWVCTLLKKPGGNLLLIDLISGIEKRYLNVNDYVFDENGKVLILQIKNGNTTQTSSLEWINLLDGLSIEIGHNLSASYFAFDDSSRQLAFLENNSINGQIVTSLQYYRIGMDSTLRIVGPTKSRINGTAVYASDIAFSKNGDKLFFKMENWNPSKLPNRCCDSGQPKIRNYLNEMLPDRPKGFLSVVFLNDSFHIVRLEKDSDLSRVGIDEYNNADYALVESIPKIKANVYRPNDQLRRDLYLISTKDGTRRLIKGNSIFKDAKFSPYGKYVIWYDKEERQWGTYRVSNGHLRTITKLIRTKLYHNDDDPKGLPGQEGIAGWFENDKSVLIYDRYDIWQVDPDGLLNPVNITSGFGRRHSIRLRYMDFVSKPFEQDFNRKHPIPIQPRDTLLLSAFNILTKENGFFALIKGKNYELRKLMLGEDVYYYPYRFSSPAISGMYYPRFPLKAKLASGYIVQRMNVDTYPNLYFTTNFKDFRPLTNLEPQRHYLWYNSELIHFALLNGQKSEGILYKPENFNPRERYPLIFYYYERNADALHFFMHPELSSGVLNIPWFVSNGYLVFVPDIVCYKRGYPGECALQAINAAANALSRLPYVSTKKMGLQGHSYGGWETNYIVTHTNRFAAAASSAGASDLVSLNSLYLGGGRGGYFEVGQGHIAASFWKHPELYIQHSPIFNADKVCTPILILHNRNDAFVPFGQGEEWFNSLSHLQKKVWLLSYPDEGHGVYAERNQLDFSIRLAQFFDHYLKDAPPPIWMTRGTSASGNGNGASLELDTSGTKP